MSERDFFSRSSSSELDQKAVILKKIVWIFLAIITCSFVTNMFIQRENVLRYSLILFLVWIVSLLVLHFLKKGFTYASAFFYVSFLILMIFAFSWTGGGIKGHGLKILPIVVLFAGLTLGKKEIWLFGVIATLGGLGLTMADYFQLLPITEPLGQSSLVYWIYNVTAIFLLCFLENLSVEELRQALVRSNEEVNLRKKSEEILIDKNKKLTEIAFLQSHMVRRPVASVLGLANLINYENPADPINLEIIPRLQTAAKELDAVIVKVVKNTHEIEAVSSN
jgi:hypothetical protein